MAKSTERHARERLGQIGQAFSTSRESIRKAGIVDRTFADGGDALMSGEYRTDELYKLAMGDDRVGIHLLVDEWLRDAINSTAKANGMTRQEYLTALLTQIFG